MYNYFGWVGLGVLLTAYVFSFLKKDKWFFLLNILSGISYITYAIINDDYPIILVNVFIIGVCLKRYTCEHRTKKN